MPTKKKDPNPATDFRGAPLQSVLDYLHVTHYDALLIGDGSGSGWSIGCGSACAVIERVAPRDRKLVWSAKSSGTVNIAELQAYADGLWWYACNARDVARSHQLRHVHIVSDSQLTVDHGNGRKDRKEMAPLWAQIECLCRMHRFVLAWHWMDRETTALNQLCDFISREARLAMEAIDPAALMPGYAYNLNNFNP